jgi:glycosyltransferase involved in cell wall biosynthesis
VRDPRRVELAVFLLGPLVGVSGGDVHALRVVEEWEADRPGTVALLAPASLRPFVPPRARDGMRAVRAPLDGRVVPMPAYVLNVCIRVVLALLRVRKADVALAGSHFFHDVIPCALLGRIAGAQVVAYVYHLVEEERGDAAGLRSHVSIALERLSVRILRRTGALVFVDNPQTRAALEARGFSPDRIVATANAYDPLEPMPPRTLAPRPTLVTVGRLTREKGVWDLLDVARRLPQADVVIVGDGPLRDPLRRRVSDEGLVNVRLLGSVDEATKWRSLRSAHAYLAPSREEGWGIAVGEALTAGLAVVAYDLPAYEHFADRLIRVPVGDVEALGLATGRLLAQPQDGRSGEPLPTWAAIITRERAAIAAMRS